MNRKRRRAGRRRGFTLLEISMAVLLVMAAMTGMVKVLGWVAAERRGIERRLFAAVEAGNLAERVAAEPFESVTAERVKALAAERAVDRVLPGASWTIAVDDDPKSPVPARKVALALRWNDRGGGPTGPVRLTSWVYRRRAQP